MPKLTDNEFDKILSEYALGAKRGGGLTGEQFYDGLELDAQIYYGAAFSELPPEEQSKFNLIAETAEEVLAEEKAKVRAA